jgi:hypothetical protein
MLFVEEFLLELVSGVEVFIVSSYLCRGCRADFLNFHSGEKVEIFLTTKRDL